MKKISLLLIALCLFTLVGCFGLNEITSLEFDNSPAGSYGKGDIVYAKDFSVKATFSDGTSETLSLTNSNLTVQGLDGDQLDTREPGIHTLKVTYKGFSITFNYVVTGPSTATTNWAEVDTTKADDDDYVVDGTTVTIKTNLGLAWFAAQVNGGTNYAGLTVLLADDIDMQAYEWAPINKFAGTFDGQGHSISNIRITKESHPYIDADEAPDAISSAAGLFGWVDNVEVTVKNLTLVNTSIDVIQYKNNELASDNTKEDFKNYGAVVGLVTGSQAIINIENVNVVNCYFRGVGRLGGLIGYLHDDTKSNIDNCYVDGSFVAYNPFTSSQFGDGDGDKIGGFIGQAMGDTNISNSMAKVNIMGTRDLGGMIGYNGRKTTITNSQLISGSVISASVAGGMELRKGPRNIGGVVGTHAPTDKLLSLNDVNVANDVVIVSNSLYAYSSAGKYVGGFRGTNTYKSDNIIITLVKGTDAPVNVAVSLDKMTDADDALTRIAQYLIDQTAALAELNSK